MDHNKLLKKSASDVKKLATKYGVDLKSDYPLSQILLADYEKSKSKKTDSKATGKKDIIGAGELEIMPEGYGFLRNSTVVNDIYVSSSQIKKLGLRNSDYVISKIREPLSSEKNYAILEAILINDNPIDKSKSRKKFDDLAPHYPDQKIKLGESISCRMIEMIAPIGRGQRALIVAPPKAGKTVLISEIANGILKSNEDVEVWVLLVDERPEEVTDIKLNTKGAKVYSSTFDEEPRNHVKVVENVMEKAKRAVEYGKHIVILVDSITRMARAYNLVVPNSGKLISGGLDPYSFVMPKKFFGSARNIKEGGSLTILGTALVDTGSRMDEVVYEEFKGTGNCEIHLDRAISELRIFPAINIRKSGTRKEELFFGKEELEAIYKMRKYLLDNFNDAEAVKKLIDLVKKEKNNDIILYKFITSS